MHHWLTCRHADPTKQSGGGRGGAGWRAGRAEGGQGGQAGKLETRTFAGLLSFLLSFFIVC